VTQPFIPFAALAVFITAALLNAILVCVGIVSALKGDENRVICMAIAASVTLHTVVSLVVAAPTLFR
jgi:hypothetical protein